MAREGSSPFWGYCFHQKQAYTTDHRGQVIFSDEKGVYPYRITKDFASLLDTLELKGNGQLISDTLMFLPAILNIKLVDRESNSPLAEVRVSMDTMEVLTTWMGWPALSPFLLIPVTN